MKGNINRLPADSVSKSLVILPLTNLHDSPDEVMETRLSLADEVRVKVVSEDPFPRQLEPTLREPFLELFVEFMELIVPGEEGGGGGGGGLHTASTVSTLVVSGEERMQTPTSV